MRGFCGLAAVLLLSLSCSAKNIVDPVPSYVACPLVDAQDHTVFFPHQNDCTKFYRCDHGSAVQDVCPSGLQWNPVADTCDWPWEAGCALSSGGNSNSGSNSGNEGNSGADNNNCAGSGNTGGGSIGGGSAVCPAAQAPACPTDQPYYVDVFFSHPTDCHWFYQCNGGVAFCKVCPSGLHWNAEKNYCDWPWQAGCIGVAVEPPTEDNKPSGGDGGSKTPISDSCPVPQPLENVFIADPNDCSLFYQCSYGVAFQQKCPAGLHFNPKAKRCDYPANVGCSATSGGTGETGGSSGTGETGGSSGTGETGGSSGSGGSSGATDPIVTPCPKATPPKCPAHDPALSVFFAHPADTHWFYHCSNGIPYCKVCPSGLVWNQANSLCGYA